MKLEHILCAAIWADDGVGHPHQPTATGMVFCGHRHHNIFALLGPMYGKLVAERRARGVAEVQGFLTSTGRFLNRKDAMQVALKAGQVQEGVRTLLPGGALDSGDLY